MISEAGVFRPFLIGPGMDAKEPAQNSSMPAANIDGVEIEIHDGEYSERMVRALTGGRYEHKERALLPNAVTPGDRVLEVGSATGLIAMLAAKIVGPRNVLTVEANPRMVDRAKRNFSRNGLQDIEIENAVLQNAALWKGPGSTVEFYISSDFWSSRLLPGPDTVEAVTVPTRCLEELIHDNCINVLICDIEGAEVDLLMGADVSLISTLMLETHPNFVGEELTHGLIERLVNCGFRIDLIASGEGVVLMRRHF
jgi:FkbM family methyltransferase